MNMKRLAIIGTFLGSATFTNSMATAAVSFVSATATQRLDTTAFVFNPDYSQTPVTTTTTDTTTSTSFTPVTKEGASSVNLSIPSAGTIQTLALLNQLSRGPDYALQTNTATYQFSVDRSSYYNFSGQIENVFLGPRGGYSTFIPLTGNISVVGTGSISTVFSGTTDVSNGFENFGATGFGKYLLGTGTYQISLQTEANAGDFYGEKNFGTLNFSIADAVPEPSTWALMIVGFGMTGGMLRRAGQRPGNHRRALAK